jgi:hypothetical protein
MTARLQQLAAEARGRIRMRAGPAAQGFDFALHLAIADHSGNFALAETIRKIWTFKRLSYLAAPEPAATLEKGYAEHLALLAALTARDAETAARDALPSPLAATLLHATSYDERLHGHSLSSLVIPPIMLPAYAVWLVAIIVALVRSAAPSRVSAIAIANLEACCC